ncbi:hypothetical protein BP5796_12990 [Coleophoma crateriformis]|uniref:Mid2 domain-containing protein n=1 Tax=Coleophoma crateriformis TaxID=565419 RepID=A0A3D8Q535_9HELO|nr:hypothetical protein BP5796_12990 [Coleophoma crateriformis]
MTCYDNTGKLASDNVPCNPNAAVSACCGIGSVCVSNLYCYDQFGDNVPGTCTDETWSTGNTPGCPCPPVYVGNGALNFASGVTLCSDGSYCCGQANTDCCVQEKGFSEISYNQPATISSGAAALFTYYAGVHVSTKPVVRSSSSTTSTKSIFPAFSTSSTVTVATSSSTPKTTKSPNGLSDGAKVGIAVGIVLGLIIISVQAFYVFKLRRTRGPSFYQPSKADVSGIRSQFEDGHDQSIPAVHSQEPTDDLVRHDAFRRVTELSGSNQHPYEMHG